MFICLYVYIHTFIVYILHYMLIYSCLFEKFFKNRSMTAMSMITESDVKACLNDPTFHPTFTQH